MNNEEKNLNEENGVEVFSLDNTSLDDVNENTINMQEGMVNSFDNTNMSEVNTTSNMFVYTDSPNSSMVEMPIQTDSFADMTSMSSVGVLPENNVQNTSYAEMPAMSSEVLQTSSTEPAQNAFLYTEMPQSPDVSVEENISQSNLMQNQFEYNDLKDTSQDAIVESPQYTSPVQSGEVSNYNGEDTNQKSNFKFMIVFAIIMLVIIFVLPYIAGYK